MHCKQSNLVRFVDDFPVVVAVVLPLLLLLFCFSSACLAGNIWFPSGYELSSSIDHTEVRIITLHRQLFIMDFYVKKTETSGSEKYSFVMPTPANVIRSSLKAFCCFCGESVSFVGCLRRCVRECVGQTIPMLRVNYTDAHRIACKYDPIPAAAIQIDCSDLFLSFSPPSLSSPVFYENIFRLGLDFTISRNINRSANCRESNVVCRWRISRGASKLYSTDRHTINIT